MDTEEFYDKPLDMATVGRRTGAAPGGMPAPTGYYPNVRGQLQYPILIGPVYDELYRPTVVGANDPGEKIDQHPWLDVTQTWTPPENRERPSGVQDPLTDGPAQPTIRDLSLHYRRQSGDSVTAYYNAPGHDQFPKNGNQDGASWTYYQDTQRALMPYDPAQTTGGQMPDTLRALPPSPAHGWAMRPLVNAQAAINAKTAALVQEQPGKQERLANSTYAGQTYSQTTARVGQMDAVHGTVHSRRGRG